MTILFFFMLDFLILIHPDLNGSPSGEDLLDQMIRVHQKYEEQLSQFRQEYGGAYTLPDCDFFLFGMGNRQKFLYRNGKLFDALSGKKIRSWEVKKEFIFPSQYAVALDLRNGDRIFIVEDEEGIWLTETNERIQLNKHNSRLKLPDFNDHRYGEILKVLHQEILVNILDSRPLPNFFVYRKPWRRDGAMMAMCLTCTGNLDLIREWVLNLDDPYDYNNGQKQGKPESEADNLGQTLYLISLFSDRSFPLVMDILAEVKKKEITASGIRYITGRSDFQEVPVYQTKWLKFGLKKLGLEDPYAIPRMPDNYSSLFWLDYREQHLPGNEYQDSRYPYLGWARDHFYNRKDGLISNRNYPLTWEKEASQADYDGMSLIDADFVEKRIAAPHTWHASEIFLYLLELNKNG